MCSIADEYVRGTYGVNVWVYEHVDLYELAIFEKTNQSVRQVRP